MFGGFLGVPPVVSIEAKKAPARDGDGGTTRVQNRPGDETLDGALRHVEFKELVIKGLDCRFVLNTHALRIRLRRFAIKSSS